jgi:transcriptional regulator with XRE-family HTH domain
MNSFVDNVTEILKAENITKNKMLTDLHLSKNSFVDWKKRGTIPSASVVSAIAEYLETTVSALMGYPDDEEDLKTFPTKLSYQLAVSCEKISDVSDYLGIADDEVMDWIKGASVTYTSYYQQLSNFFR